jgi:hypothetical protein
MFRVGYAVEVVRREREHRRRRTARYRDAAGLVTSDPAQAVSGEVVDVDVHGTTRRTRFFLQREELPWLPVGEAAFLLWVLVAFVLAWIGIGLVLVLM